MGDVCTVDVDETAQASRRLPEYQAAHGDRTVYGRLSTGYFRLRHILPFALVTRITTTTIPELLLSVVFTLDLGRFSIA